MSSWPLLSCHSRAVVLASGPVALLHAWGVLWSAATRAGMRLSGCVRKVPDCEANARKMCTDACTVCCTTQGPYVARHHLASATQSLRQPVRSWCIRSCRLRLRMSSFSCSTGRGRSTACPTVCAKMHAGDLNRRLAKPQADGSLVTCVQRRPNTQDNFEHQTVLRWLHIVVHARLQPLSAALLGRLEPPLHVLDRFCGPVRLHHLHI